MKRILCLGFLCALAGYGQAAERVFCEGANCTENTLEVKFGPLNGGVADGPSETRAAAGEELTVHVASDVAVEDTQGWSMGLRHDPAMLEILTATTEGLGLPAIFFETTTLAVGDPSPGFVSAVVLEIFPAPGATLPVGTDVPLALATYRVLVDLDPDNPTLLELADDLVPNEGSPATATNFTIAATTLRPALVVDGEVRGPAAEPQPQPEPQPGVEGYGLFFGAAATTDPVEITGDAFPITMQNEAPALGFSLGVSVVDGTYSFVDGGLGTAEDRALDLVITDDAGASITPASLNTGTRAELPTDVTRGAAIAGLEGDFFTVDLVPAFGGPGFTAGYVVDVMGTGNSIPAGTNEILVMSYGVIADCSAEQYAFSFGDNPDSDLEIAPEADSVSIFMTNLVDSIGFSFGVSTTEAGMTFSEEIGAAAGRPVRLFITDVDGTSHRSDELVTNSASNAGGLVVDEIVRGEALEGITDGDFLSIDLAPAVGGPGFTVGYVSDTTGTGSVIPAVTVEGGCRNEILRINLISPLPPAFIRGDVDGDGELSVADAAIDAQLIFFGEESQIASQFRFNCDDRLDASDDGILDTADPITILGWVFLAAADLAPPFLVDAVPGTGCGQDPTEDELTCEEAVCIPADGGI